MTHWARSTSLYISSLLIKSQVNSIDLSWFLHQLGSREVLVEREVKVDVTLGVPSQHRGHHKVGFVDSDQTCHLIVGHSGLELTSWVGNRFQLLPPAWFRGSVWPDQSPWMQWCKVLPLEPVLCAPALPEVKKLKKKKLNLDTLTKFWNWILCHWSVYLVLAVGHEGWGKKRSKGSKSR